MRVLVTGAAGFIGHALCLRLLDEGHIVIGLDNLNPYYDVKLKRARLDQLQPHINFKWAFCDLQDVDGLEKVFALHNPEIVVNLAAQAGVRYSIEAPQKYIDSNITGFLNILEMCVKFRVEHLLYASSSSVYGLNDTPFSVDDRTDCPTNMYAVTKKANELMARAYSNLHGLSTTGLRFFTVYGPWGRPDMAFFKFAKAILKGEPIDVYNNGQHTRAFTFIDDIVDGITKAMAVPNGAQIFNIGGDQATTLLSAIDMIALQCGKRPILNLMPMQKGDVESTIAEESRIPDYSPKVGIEDGMARFVGWFRGFYNV